MVTHARTHRDKHLWHCIKALMPSVAFNSIIHRCRTLSDMSMRLQPPPIHFSNDDLVARSPGTGEIFIRRLYWEIHLIFVSITHSSLLSLLLSLLFCHAFLFILPVFTVAVSNPATLREEASISHSSHTPTPFAFSCTRG